MLGNIKSFFSTRKSMAQVKKFELLHDMSDEELKALQGCFLDMMKDIIRVCEKHHICYLLAGGTALGAVRHKGFIPWDDDVDLLMPRRDLNRFVKIFGKELGDGYELCTPNASPYMVSSLITEVYKKNTRKTILMNINTPFPKGVHIDIFPIEAVPEGKAERNIKGVISLAAQYWTVSSLMYAYRDPRVKKFFGQTMAGRINYRIRMILGFLSSFRPYEFWYNHYDKFIRGRDSEVWAVPTDIGHYFGHIMPKDVYVPPVKGTFEGMEVNLPHDVDAYLKNQYGDYMKIPPVEDREKHYFVDFCLDLSKEKEEKDGAEIGACRE